MGTLSAQMQHDPARLLRSGSTAPTNYGTAAPASGAPPPQAAALPRLSPRAVGLFSSLGGFLFGVDIGYISGIEVMDSFRADVNGGEPPSDATMGLITAIFALGALLAASPPVSDALVRLLGTRSAIAMGAAVFCAGAILQASAFGLEVMYVGRFVSGASVGVLSTLVPIYQSELASAETRGGIVALYQLAITIGIMAAFWLNFAIADVPHGWRISVIAQLLPGAGLAVGMLCALFVDMHPVVPRGKGARWRALDAGAGCLRAPCARCPLRWGSAHQGDAPTWFDPRPSTRWQAHAALTTWAGGARRARGGRGSAAQSAPTRR